MKKLAIIISLLILTTTSGFSPTQNSFSGGQVSPLFETRIDYLGYSFSCRTVENMFVTVLGPVERRPGTKFISDVFSSGQYGYGAYGEDIYGE